MGIKTITVTPASIEQLESIASSNHKITIDILINSAGQNNICFDINLNTPKSYTLTPSAGTIAQWHSYSDERQSEIQKRVTELVSSYLPIKHEDHLGKGTLETVLLTSQLSGNTSSLISLIKAISEEQLLQELTCFQLPITGADGKAFTRIETFICSSQNEVLTHINLLPKFALGLFITLYLDETLDDSNPDLDSPAISISLHSNSSAESNNLKAFEDNGLTMKHCEYFSLFFEFCLNNKSGKATKLSPSRFVNPLYRGQGICTQLSLNFLNCFYDHVGDKNTQYDASNATAAATIKFGNPLHGYTLESGELLTDVEPSSVNTSELIKVKCLRAFSKSDSTSSTKLSPMAIEEVSLQRLLKQHEIMKRIRKLSLE